LHNEFPGGIAKYGDKWVLPIFVEDYWVRPDAFMEIAPIYCSIMKKGEMDFDKINEIFKIGSSHKIARKILNQWKGFDKTFLGNNNLKQIITLDDCSFAKPGMDLELGL